MKKPQDPIYAEVQKPIKKVTLQVVEDDKTLNTTIPGFKRSEKIVQDNFDEESEEEEEREIIEEINDKDHKELGEEEGETDIDDQLETDSQDTESQLVVAPSPVQTQKYKVRHFVFISNILELLL